MSSQQEALAMVKALTLKSIDKLLDGERAHLDDLLKKQSAINEKISCPHFSADVFNQLAEKVLAQGLKAYATEDLDTAATLLHEAFKLDRESLLTAVTLQESNIWRMRTKTLGDIILRYTG